MAKTSNLTKAAAKAAKHIPDDREFAYICYLHVVHGLDDLAHPSSMISYFNVINEGYKAYLTLTAEVREEVKAYLAKHNWSMPKEVEKLEKDLTS